MKVIGILVFFATNLALGMFNGNEQASLVYSLRITPTPKKRPITPPSVSMPRLEDPLTPVLSEGETPKVLLYRTFRIVSKPKAVYTDEARASGLQGQVVLEITFLANRTIGKIRTIKGLGDGLTDMAIAAARKITFEPQLRNGKPITVKKNVEFSFSIY